MSNNLKRFLSLIILLVIFAAIGYYLTVNADLLLSLSHISIGSVFLLIFLRFLFLATNGLFLQAFAAKFEIDLKFVEWFGLSVVTAFGNYITPFSGGLIARATYLKHQHNFPYTQFVALLASNYLVNFWVIGIIGSVTIITWFNDLSRFSWQILFLFLALTVSISILALVPPFSLPASNKFFRLINTSLTGWSVVKKDKVLLVKLVTYSLINILLNGVSFWVAYQALDFNVSFLKALMVSLMSVFSLLLNVTPGNLGIQEAVIGLSSALLDVGTGEGLVAALIVRATTVIFVFLMGPLFGYLLSHRITTSKHLNVKSQ
ncbi:MAG: flippase-like domain-containing protein [Anaerolineae bacterium]|nr:flippase-like domain-containing protein [Anaerolineae bacterium]